MQLSKQHMEKTTEPVSGMVSTPWSLNYNIQIDLGGRDRFAPAREGFGE